VTGSIHLTYTNGWRSHYWCFSIMFWKFSLLTYRRLFISLQKLGNANFFPDISLTHQMRSGQRFFS